MKRFQVQVLVVALIAVTGCAPKQLAAQNTGGQAAAAPAAGGTSNDGGWPKQYSSDGYNIVVYQPQLDSWQGNQLQGRAAVSVTAPGAAQPTFGVIWVSSRTDVNKEAGIVALDDIRVTRANFPTASASNATYLAEIQKSLPTAVNSISLARLQANLTVTQAEQRSPGVPVQNTPPNLIFSQTPAILVLIDGTPALRPTSVSNLLRVINTQALVVLDQSTGTYFLYVENGWMQASEISGPWSAANSPAAGLDQVKQAAGTEVNLYAQTTTGTSTTVYVSTTPAELVVTTGPPQFNPIDGTSLLSVTNTTSDVFMDTSSNDYYVLVTGRWFRSASLSGPWAFVASTQLPADFANIPTNHPKGNALASVAGTPQAQEAAITNTIPQTATVQISGPTLDVAYDGSPQFKPIESTPLQYAINTGTPVIQVDSETYYASQNGLWFIGTSPQGPWVVATSVPAVIYTIPPSSPIYYVTYVRLYGSTPQVVYVGYTPGYESVYVAPDGTVVYGTGYVYQPWVGSVWYGPPATYGFGAGFGWGMAAGFAVGFASSAWCHPWWGPVGWGGSWGAWGAHYNYAHVTVNNYYNRWGNSATVAHSGNSYAGHVGNTTFAGNKNGDVYADHNGNVYRDNNGNWQKYGNDNSWQNVNRPTDDSQTAKNDAAQVDKNDGAARDDDADRNAGDAQHSGGDSFNRSGNSVDSLDRDAYARNLGNARAGGDRGFGGWGGGGGRGGGFGGFRGGGRR